MKPLPNERFWSSTQGRIVTMLRGGTRTVNELARPLELSDNAVRAHLTTLERDGLVQQAGSRKGIRKPNLTYALTPDAGHLFPKEYAVILGHLDAQKYGRDRQVSPDLVQCRYRHPWRGTLSADHS